MTKPLTVRDRHGNLVERPDGKMLDGDKVQRIHVPMMFSDGAASVSTATLASAAQILGDKFVETEIAGLSDQAARHAVVCKRIGSAADGRSAAYLDAAWGALAGTGSPAPAAAILRPIALSDEQVAMGREGVRRALADAAAKPALQRHRTMMDVERKAGNDRIWGSYCAMKAAMNDEWRGGLPPAVTLDPRVEAAFRAGKITDSPTNRARAELAQEMSDGWKTGR